MFFPPQPRLRRGCTRNPAAVVKKLNSALREIIDSPDVQARFKNVGFEGFSSTPEELGAFIKVQLGVWEKMVKDADIKPN